MIPLEIRLDCDPVPLWCLLLLLLLLAAAIVELTLASLKRHHPLHWAPVLHGSSSLVLVTVKQNAGFLFVVVVNRWE